MKQFVLVPASVLLCKTNLIAQSVKKQELPKSQPLQNSMYQNDSLKKEVIKKSFFRRRFLSRQNFLLSTYQALIFRNFNFARYRKWTFGIFLLYFAQQLRRRNADVPDYHFTLLDTAGVSSTLILNQNAKAKNRGSLVLFNIWTTEASKAVHTGWCCLWVCAQLSETRYLSVSKVGQFLHSKSSSTKFTPTTSKLKIMEAIARFNNEICCLGLAYVDKLARDKTV